MRIARTSTILQDTVLATLFGTPIILLILHFRTNTLINILLVTLLLIGFNLFEVLSKRLKWIILTLMLCIVIGKGINWVRLIRFQHSYPPAFDYQLYWTYGQASANGLNPYNQANTQKFVEFLQPPPPPNMLDQLFFFQTPPTLFLFAPLGWFDLNTGVVVWQTIHGLILIIDIILLWAYFLHERGYTGLLFVASLAMLFVPTFDNIFVTQVNFLLLLILLFFWRKRDQPQAGLWLALGTFVKPIMLVFGLYSLMKRNWLGIAACIASMAIASGLTILIYGPSMFADYFVNNSIANHMPVRLYYSPDNQSLSAMLLRASDYKPATDGAPLENPIFWGLTAILIVVTSILVFRTDKNDWAFLLILGLALLIFPKTLWHYSFMLLLPIVLIWTKRYTLPGKFKTTSALILLIYAITAFQGGTLNFFANALVWCISAAKLVYDLILEGSVPNLGDTVKM